MTDNTVPKRKRTNKDLQNYRENSILGKTNPQNTGVKIGAPKGYAVPAPPVTPVVLLLL
jgi:hypothetical protein